MSDWKSFCLGDVVTFQRGYDLPKSKMINGIYPVIGSNGIIGWHNQFTTENPSITLGRSGNVGQPFIYYGKSWAHNTTLFIKEFKNVHPEFIYYLLKTLKLNHYAGGTAVPTLNRNHIKNIPIKLPPLATQKKIAAVLSALDDKIELNNAINKNLEEQLNRVYDKIFQSTKKIIELGAVIKTTSGGTPSRKNSSFYKDGQICWVKSKELSGKYIIDTEEKINEIALKNSSAKILPEHSVLIAMYGATVGEYGIISKPMTCNQAVCALIANEQYPFSYLYQIAKESKSYFLNMAVGSAQQNISQILIKQLPVHDDILRIKKFHSFAAPIHGILKNLQTENKKLGEIRDSLLPRLMSGEIDVSEVEI